MRIHAYLILLKKFFFCILSNHNKRTIHWYWRNLCLFIFLDGSVQFWHVKDRERSTTMICLCLTKKMKWINGTIRIQNWQHRKEENFYKKWNATKSTRIWGICGTLSSLEYRSAFFRFFFLFFSRKIKFRLKNWIWVSSCRTLTLTKSAASQTCKTLKNTSFSIHYFSSEYKAGNALPADSPKSNTKKKNQTE